MSAARTGAAAIEDMAALWLVRREDADWSADDARALQDWLDGSMAHKAAFWRLEHGWREADRIGALGGEAHVAPPRRRGAARLRALGATVWRSRAAWSIAASLLVAIGVFTMMRIMAPGPVEVASFATGVGGNRVVRLVDGSQVQLNTATRIRTAVAHDAREVWLDEGEAYFDVVHRPDRQFVVHAGPRTITVLGTRFTVRRHKDTVTVAVLSGRVRVDDVQAARAPERTAVVSTGDVAFLEPRATLISVAGPANVEAMTAWRDHRIVFDDVPLSKVVDEFNRYTNDSIRIDDPALAEMRIGGSFRTGDSRAFVDLMRTAYGVRVQRERDVTTLSR